VRLSERALPEAGISKSYCATSSSWPEVEPRFCPWIIWSINWSGDLTWALLYVAVMQRGARPKVSLKWTDLKLIARTHRMTKSSASWIESSTYSIRCSFLRAILQPWLFALGYNFLEIKVTQNMKVLGFERIFLALFILPNFEREMAMRPIFRFFCINLLIRMLSLSVLSFEFARYS